MASKALNNSRFRAFLFALLEWKVLKRIQCLLLLYINFTLNFYPECHRKELAAKLPY